MHICIVLDYVHGMHPDANIHDTFVDVEVPTRRCSAMPINSIDY
jgi:hypothetical protein